MPDIRSRQDVSSARSARQVWPLALVIMTALAAISGAAASGGSPQAAARAAAQARPAAVAAVALHGSDAGRARTRAGGQPGAPTATPAPAALPRVAVPTISMDAPIQHGLTAHQEQALSARLISAHKTATAAPTSAYWTPAMGRSAVARASSWLGMPYSWAGGDASGPTPGRCDVGTGGDLDCHVVGFDCSGLMMYAWGAYASLPHLAAAQLDAGAFHPAVRQLLPGDLVFFSGYLPGGTGHVAIYTGHGMIIEAPQSGSVIRRATLADAMAEDGVYRGAVRPLTGRTPTLIAPRVAVPPTGGTLTLRGANLAAVDAVHLGGVTVRRFVRHSDTAIVLRVPAHDAGRVAVTVSTSWLARSRAVTLTYARPRPAPPVAEPTAPTAPVSLPPTSSPTAPVSSSPPASPSSPPKAPSSPPTTPSSPPASTSPPTSPTSPSTTAPGSTSSGSTQSAAVGSSTAG